MKNKIVDILMTVLYVICFIFILILFIPITLICIILMPFITFLGFLADLFAGVYNDY